QIWPLPWLLSNLDPEIPGCKVHLVRLMVFMFSHASSFTDGQHQHGEPRSLRAPCGPVALVLIPLQGVFWWRSLSCAGKTPPKRVSMPRKLVIRRDGGLILRNGSGVRQEAPG